MYFIWVTKHGAKTIRYLQKSVFVGRCNDGFTIEDSEASAFKLLNSLKLIKLAVSLGSNESLAQHPYSMTHTDVPDDEKKEIGISEGLIRLSVGIENYNDLIEDLSQALK